MIIHIFEAIPHHYLNFVGFFMRHACGGKWPQPHRHVVYIASSGDSEQDNAHQQQLLALGVARVVVYDHHAGLLAKLNQEARHSQFIFHSLLSRWLWLRLRFSGLLPRSHWVSWGADLYQHTLGPSSLKQRIARRIQASACARLRSVTCLNPGDAQLLTQVLGRQKVEVRPYPIVGVSAPVVSQQDKATGQAGQPIRLLLGNSAAPSNNHHELIAAVQPFIAQASHSERSIRCYMPLNYAGRADYVQQIIDHGREQLGAAFVPITEMLTKQDYDQLLASVDGAVFAHDRQQGLYVAYYMLLNGKKLFLKQTTSTYQNFIHYGLHIESLEQLASQSLSHLAASDPQHRLNNQTIVTQQFTETALGPKWGAFFASLSFSAASAWQ